MSKPISFITRSGAERFVARLHRAWPKKKFEIVQSPDDYKWKIALISDNTLNKEFRIHSYVTRPRHPLTGEYGYKETRTNKFEVEYTDLFCGEVNYAWVRRTTIEVSETAHKKTIMQKAKATVGLTGQRGDAHWYGDDAAKFIPYKRQTVLFIHFTEG